MARGNWREAIEDIDNGKSIKDRSVSELEALRSNLMREARSRMNAIKDAGLKQSSAMRYWTKHGLDAYSRRMKKEKEKGNYINYLRKQVFAAYNFLQAETSTVAGAIYEKSYLNRRFGVDLSPEEVERVWEVMDILRDKNASLLVSYTVELEKVIEVAKSKRSVQEMLDEIEILQANGEFGESDITAPDRPKNRNAITEGKANL